MFKRFLPTLAPSNPISNHGETLFDLEASSGNSSSKRSDCSSEQINKSDIPTLRRRHSFVTTYAESVLEEEINRTNGNADLSIDPFDSSNTLKRSKSLSFNLSRRPSFSTLRKKVPKSVHFEPLEEVIEVSDYNSKPTVVPILYGNSETFEGRSKEKPSVFRPNLEEKGGTQNQLRHIQMNVLGSQESEIQPRYPLFSEERIISELEFEESQASQKEVLNDNFLPLETISNTPITEEYEESENDNSCLFTEYSQENRYDDNSIGNNKKADDDSEKSVQEDEVVHNNEHQMMRAIMQNLVKIGNYELEDIEYEIDHSSWQGILDYSEKAKDAISVKDTEIAQLENQLKEKDNGKSEKVYILQEECVTLQNELNSCKIAKEQVSTKYDLLVGLNNELEANEKCLRNDIMQLETDLSSSVSRLQVECGFREEILTLIKKYDCSKELSDSVDALKDYIELLFLKNESVIKENNYILEHQLRMKNEITSLEENLKTTLDREQETLKSVTDENERLKTSLEELQLKLNDSDMIAKEKSEQTKILAEKDLQISKFKSQVVFLKEEKEYSQAKLSEYLADVEEANKQIKEELVFRNQMEKVYNQLKTRMKETESLLHKEVKIANDQLIIKQSELTELSDINSKIKQEMIAIKEDLKSIKDEKEKLVVENQKHVRENAEYKLNLNLLQEHIKKSNKNVDIMSKEYLMVLKSNEIISSAIKRFAMATFQSLEPVMYEESREYFRKIYSDLLQQTLFSQGKVSTIESVSQFITRCISDIVCQYLENETLLQSEVENRNNNYQRMLDKLTKIMEDNILNAYNSKENINDIGITRKLQSKNKMDMESHRRGIVYKNPNQ